MKAFSQPTYCVACLVLHGATIRKDCQIVTHKNFSLHDNIIASVYRLLKGSVQSRQCRLLLHMTDPWHQIPSLPTTPAGMKYRYAKQWGVHCVTVQWFHDSVAAGYSMPEEDYDVDQERGEGRAASEGGASGTSRKRYCV